jgi:hypothetical protein
MERGQTFCCNLYLSVKQCVKVIFFGGDCSAALISKATRFPSLSWSLLAVVVIAVGVVALVVVVLVFFVDAAALIVVDVRVSKQLYNDVFYTLLPNHNYRL